MNGLEQILRKIEEESQAAADKLISDAQDESKRIMSEQVKKAEIQAQEILGTAEKHSEQLDENAESGCEALIRKGDLQAKADIVSAWIKKAMHEIKEMDTEEYFSTLFNLVLSHSSKQCGELILNEADKKRMPANFMNMLNDALEDASTLTLSDENADIDDGCIIRYGGIEENCSFDALLEEKADEIKDRLFALINS